MSDESVELEREISRIIRTKQAQRKAEMEDGSLTLPSAIFSSELPDIGMHLRAIRQQFGNRIIRRTPSSRGWDGKPILSLPGVTVVLGLLRLKLWEQEALAELAKGDAEEARAGFFWDATVCAHECQLYWLTSQPLELLYGNSNGFKSAGMGPCKGSRPAYAPPLC